MHTLDVRFAASVTASSLLRCRKTEQKVEEAELQQRHRHLQQFFTSFTNRDGAFYQESCSMGQLSVLERKHTSTQRRVLLLPLEVCLVKVSQLVQYKLIPVSGVAMTEFLSALVRRVGAL
ncbi:MAG TPA: hypothetical protein V6D43_04655 [Candidatus Sericytochromatia bacterium]|jgi:hypothetical protein